MRKLFVLFLLVALVPFTVGCNGLWDFDDDTDAVAQSTLKMARIFPAGTFATKGATVAYLEDLTLVVDGITMVYDSHTFDASGSPVVTFKAVIPTATLQALQAKADAGTTVTAEVRLGTTVIETVAALTLPTTITENTTATVAAVVVPDFSKVTDPASFKVTSVTFGGTALGNSANGAIVVNSMTPTFSVAFDTAYATLTDVTFEVVVKNVTTGTSYTLKTGETGLTVAANGTNGINVTVGTASNGEKLASGYTYSVQVTKTNLKTAAGIPLAIPAAYYFTTNF